MDGAFHLFACKEVLERSRLANSEVLFGSASRGDHDQFSDRDILIIDSDTEVLKSRRSVLEENGYSVAAYTWTKLEKLSQLGALFVQHLKTESRILRDESARFVKLVGEFRPKSSYAVEIQSNMALASIAKNYPATAVGALWTADVLYVWLRNFGVLKLAEYGRYKFAYHSILDELVEEKILSQKQATSLRQLRLMKSFYRQGFVLSSLKSETSLKEMIAAIPRRLLPLNYVSVPPNKIIFDAVPLPNSAPAYHRLRNLEKIYLSLIAVNPSAKEDPNFMRLKRWIEDPRMYAGFAVVNEAKLVAAAKEVPDHCTLIARSAP